MKKLYALIMLFVSIDMSAQTLEGDVNKDGKLTIEDVTKVIELYLNYEDPQISSTLYRVFFFFNVMSYPELFNTIGNPGQYISVCSVQHQLEDTTGKPISMETCVEMHSPFGTQLYALSKTDATSFYFGLAGIIIGTTYDLENVAYDLGCPNCNYNSDKTRLLINTNGTAACPNCNIVYDLNNHGAISTIEKNSVHCSPRGLYRYRVTYDGTKLLVYN